MNNTNKTVIWAVFVVILAFGAGFWIFNRSGAPTMQDSSGMATVMPEQQVPVATPTPTTVAAGSTSSSPATPSTVVSTTVTVKKPLPATILKSFTVSGQNFSFSPATITVKKGDAVKIIFQNSGGMHDLRIDQFNVATKRIRSGQEDSVEFVANQAGSFEYYCSVGNHRAMGMRGTLVVQ